MTCEWLRMFDLLFWPRQTCLSRGLDAGAALASRVALLSDVAYALTAEGPQPIARHVPMIGGPDHFVWHQSS